MNHLILFEDFGMRTLSPLSSLEWEFWNQSRSKIFSEADEFTKHTNIFKADIIDAAEKAEKSEEDIISHLKKFWDVSRTGDYIDMRDSRKKFQDLRDALHQNEFKKIAEDQ